MTKNYRDFEDARKFVRKLKFSGKTGWREYCKSDKPQDIPSNPDQIYKNKGWTNWGDWFGTWKLSHDKRNFKSFEDAREFARSLKLNGQIEWNQYVKSGKKPMNIPSSPYFTYKGKGWKGYGDWLGTNRIAPFKREFLKFSDAKKEAQKLAIKLNLQTSQDWTKAYQEGKIPKHLPANPWKTYSKKRLKKI